MIRFVNANDASVDAREAPAGAAVELPYLWGLTRTPQTSGKTTPSEGWEGSAGPISKCTHTESERF